MSTAPSQASEVPEAPSQHIVVEHFELPKFALQLYSRVSIDGREYRTRQKLGRQWLFIDIQTEDSKLLTDADIAGLQACGEFLVLESGLVSEETARPLSPLVCSEKVHQSNLRKSEYVTACLALGDSLRRSRSVLNPILREVAERRGEKPPGFTSVLNWLQEHRRYGSSYGTAAYSDRHDLKGSRRTKLASFQETAIEAGINVYLARITVDLAYATVCERVREYDIEFGSALDKDGLGPRFVQSNGNLRPPSKRTFERRCAAIDRFTRDVARRGERYARSRNRTYATVALPERPYEQVEVDHGRLDILIVDESGIEFGRPDIIVFRDRATSMILGFSIGFEEPSYAAFIQGLRHTIYPKDLSHLTGIENKWPCFGRIENLFVDNALHFIGHNIEEAGRELGFNVVRLAPRSPWLKGALERFFGSLNAGLLHPLPGTTLENVLARRDHETLGDATLSLTELEGLITKWICDIYHVRTTKGLGIIRGVGDVPLNVWNKKAKTFQTAPLPSMDTFIALAGDTIERTIQRDGVVWEHIKYEGASLISILTDTRHRARQAGKPTTKYKLVRDPQDLGTINLINHHTGEVLALHATDAHRKYADGLTLHQHRVIIARAKEQVRGECDVDQLMRTKAQLAELICQLRNKPIRKKVQRKLARYLQRETAKKLSSAISTQDFDDSSATGFLDLAAHAPEIQETFGDAVLAPPRPHQKRPPGPRADAGVPSDDLSDLDQLKNSKNWSVSDGRTS